METEVDIARDPWIVAIEETANYYNCDYIDGFESKGLLSPVNNLKGETMQKAEESLRCNVQYPQGLWSLIKYE